jgi:hypothetical protein
MAKQYDFSDFDETPTSSGYDFSDFDDSAPTEMKSEPKVSQPEAFGIGAIQGATVGTAPIASGIGGSLMNAAEQIGDKMGLTTDSQLEEGIDVSELPGLSPELKSKLEGQKTSVTLPEKKAGLEGLMSEYYDSRNRMKGLQEAAANQHPITTLTGNIVSSAPQAGAALFGIAGKAGLGAKIAQGAKEGAAIGAATGFGSGDAKMFGEDGSVSDVAREVADSTVGGGLVGGALPVAGSLTKGAAGFVGDLPIAKQIGTAFKGGKAGINLDEDSAAKAIKTYSEDLLTQIQSQFKKAGLTKANAMDYADEVGVRVNAGEAFQDVMDDIISRGASSGEDLAEKMKLYNSLKSLKEGAPDKMQNKLDLNSAKMQQKMEAKGYELLDSDTQTGNVSDFIPGTQNSQPLSLTTQNYQKINNPAGDALEALTTGGEKELSKPIQKLIQQSGQELPININQYDLDNLSAREVGDILSEINRHTGDLTGPAKTKSEQIARGLAAQIKQRLDDAMEEVGSKTGNKELSRTFSALERAGIDDNILTQNSIRKDAMVDKLRNTVTAGNPINRERMFQYLEEASPQGYKGFKDGAEFLNEFNDLAKQVKPLNSSNVTGLLGSAKNIGLTAANKSGAGYQGLKNLVEMPVEKLSQIAEKMGMSSNKAAQQFSSPLLKAAQGDERKRSAILYGLYQQPAFRDAYQSLGEGVNDIILPVGTDRENNK